MLQAYVLFSMDDEDSQFIFSGLASSKIVSPSHARLTNQFSAVTNFTIPNKSDH
jgi:hypothetical protein